ncbi:MAG: Stp1/IreP family PP2C-type Ser/Thr phosphatase [Eggerthellaceae bacterium]|nr:Stp1/IreP family PP2C-type Ser/Thr phosphatase [Eggerthellaceae bacterium]
MAKRPLKVTQISPSVLGRHAAAADAGTGPVRRAFARVANALGARVGRSGIGATREESAAKSGISLPNVGETLVNASKAHLGTIAYGCGTDTGRMRDHNEDSFFAAPPLFVVADGMGGHAAGEVASELAIQTVSQLAPAYPNAAMLSLAIDAANTAVYEESLKTERRHGMGTTITAAMLKGTRLVIAQVGDSRAYLLHNGVLQQLTRDHSLMADLIESGEITPEEARTHPQRNFITRALGTGASVETDLYELNVSPGDRLLLCSDGLSGMLEDGELATALMAIRDPQTCVNNLLARANEAGGCDNVTAIVVDVTASDTAEEEQARRHSITTAAIIAGVAVLLIVAAALLMWALVRGNANTAGDGGSSGTAAVEAVADDGAGAGADTAVGEGTGADAGAPTDAGAGA